MKNIISTHAPAGGATETRYTSGDTYKFLLTPLRAGRLAPYLEEFYGDVFLLTPLREGRPAGRAL